MTRLGKFLLGPALVCALVVGCAEHRRVVVDTYGPGETTYYAQWEHETHRDHVEYERRQKAEQHEYWEWRHHHHDDNH
jgi:hypothetical protein